MDKKMNNEELQSRREFFKKAAKATLPMIAAVALASAPAIVNAAETASGCRGCASYCTGGCSGNCVSCVGSCNNTCNFTCRGHCKTSSGKY